MTATLRPIFALFARSLREQSRMKFTYFSRGALALIVLLLIGMNHRDFAYRSAPGEFVLVMVVTVNFFAIAIFGLSTFASAITEEKEDDSLGLLRMTRLNPLSILLGKGTARLCEGLLLLAVQVPFTMLCITLGGVSLAQVLRCYAILAAFLFLLSNVALFWSVVCRRTGRASTMTTITGVVLYFMPVFLMPLVFTSRLRGGQNPSWYESFAQFSLSINPVFDLSRTAIPRGGGLPFTVDSIMASLVIGAVAFLLAWVLFERFCKADASPAAAAPRKSAPAAVRRRSAVPRPGRNAIAWKDFHFMGGGWRGILIRLVAYAALIALLCMWVVSVGGRFKADHLGFTLVWSGIIAFVIEAGLLGARMFGVERKRNTLGSLYTLPIDTGTLIRQKIRGILPGLIPSAAIVLSGFIVLGLATNGPSNLFDDDVLQIILLWATQTLLFAVLCVYLSLRMRRGVFASAVGIMFGGNFILTILLGSGGADGIAVLCVLLWVAIFTIAACIPGRIGIAAAGE